MKEAPPERPCVYFIQCTETLAVKIGWTIGWPRDRMAALQTSSAWELDLIYGVPSARREHEASWHRVFASRHLRGEWYRITEREVMDAINAYYDICGTVDRDARPVPHEMIALGSDGSIRKLVSHVRQAHYNDKGLLDFTGCFWGLPWERLV